MTTWSELLTAADSGELSLDPHVAPDLLGACDRYIEDLRDILETARNVEYVTGFGGMPSGAILEAKFTAKGSGPASIQARLREHIEEVTAIRAVIVRAVAAYHETDAANADRLAQLGAQLGPT